MRGESILRYWKFLDSLEVVPGLFKKNYGSWPPTKILRASNHSLMKSSPNIKCNGRLLKIDVEGAELDVYRAYGKSTGR